MPKTTPLQSSVLCLFFLIQSTVCVNVPVVNRIIATLANEVN